MPRYKFVTILLILIVLSPISTSYSAQLKNQLLDNPAPYLALHGNDPVAWQEWEKQALDKAHAENKIIFVSIGYFACHWCHVMQQESYQNEEIANLLNANFIPIKIDRELEPALDARLMKFTQSVLGRGGWPLNVFLTPEGRPIYSALYLPKEHFQKLITRLQLLWESDEARIRGLVVGQEPQALPPLDANLDQAEYAPLLEGLAEKIMLRADEFSGGFGKQSKFPSVPQLEYLLDDYGRTESVRLKTFLELTLDTMATQGLHDHLSGGFFRYSVDPEWQVPHFEKMLYDNANLATLYSKAGNQLKNPKYHLIAKQTLDFMQSDMWLDGALVASLSAVDEQNIEGGYYLWQQEQIASILTAEELTLVTTVWDFEGKPELEAGNHLRWSQSLEQYATSSGRSLPDLQKLLGSVTKKMLADRDNRSLPVDHKLVAGWNGLALSAFVLGAKQYPDSGYAKTAKSLRQFLGNKIWNRSSMTRAIVKGGRYGSASLEDYAYVSKGLLDWALFSEMPQDFTLAEEIARTAWSLFFIENSWHGETGSLLSPSEGSEIVQDGALASPAAVLIATSFDIATRLGDQQWLRTIRGSINRGKNSIAGSPFWYASHAKTLQHVLGSL